MKRCDDMKKKGFTLIELMVVVGLIAILFGIAPIIYSKYLNEERLKDALSKIKYDMQYLQSLRQNKTSNYIIAFRKSITEGIDVTGVNDSEIKFDYVCFEDENNDLIADISEVIIDPFDNKKMMYDFELSETKLLAGGLKLYPNKIFENINLSEIKVDGVTFTDYIFRFSRFGSIERYNGTTWEELENDMMIELSLYSNDSVKKQMKIAHLTGEILIQN